MLTVHFKALVGGSDCNVFEGALAVQGACAEFVDVPSLHHVNLCTNCGIDHL